MVTKTAHAVAVDGRWRWILTRQRFGITVRSCVQAPSTRSAAP